MLNVFMVYGISKESWSRGPGFLNKNTMYYKLFILKEKKGIE